MDMGNEFKDAKILVVDDSKLMIEMLKDILAPEEFYVSIATTGEQALEIAKEEKPDLILLDIVLPGINGIEVKSRLNAHKSTAIIPVIFVTSKDAPADKIKGFNMSVDDYITKPYNKDELLARIKGTLRRRKLYEEISMTDGLTGLHNIHYFKKQFSLFFNIAKRYQKTFSLGIIDVNDFKVINDTHGHAVGDFVLRNIATIVSETLRKSDIVTRYGGDEFAIIFTESNIEQSHDAMNRVQEEMQKQIFYYPEKDLSLQCSISVGIVGYETSLLNETEMFDLADTRMYEDKRKKKKESCREKEK